MSGAGSNGYLLEEVRRLGSVARFFVQLLVQCVPALGRWRLWAKQIYNAGARSLIIIMLSGLFLEEISHRVFITNLAQR